MTATDELSHRAQARLGAVLNGKWRLDAVLGIGGMATVYAATHRNRSRVAIKMLHAEVAISHEVTSRFLREGYVGNAVAHTGTVKVLDDDVTDDGAPFLVMELLEGESLGARLDREGRLPAHEVALIADQLLDVLAAAHAAHIVHRDLKPDNLFLTNEGRIKVLDFGIARLSAAAQASSAATQAGSLLGTPAFMAPEQALGRWKEVDERTDIWAVGATLFTLLTGRFVHEAEAVQEQLVRAATQRAIAVGTLAPETPAWLASVVDRALSFAREERFPDARSMQGALRATASGIEFAPRGGVHSPFAGPRPRSSAGLPSSPSLGEGVTLVAPSAEPPAVSSGRTYASVQAVARSAQQPLVTPRSKRTALTAAGAVAVAFVGLVVAWGGHTAATGKPAADELSGPTPPAAAGAPLAVTALLTATASVPVTAPSAARAPLSAISLPPAPERPPQVSPRSPPSAVALQRPTLVASAGRPPVAFSKKLPKVPPPPLHGKEQRSPPQENLFDSRH